MSKIEGLSLDPLITPSLFEVTFISTRRDLLDNLKSMDDHWKSSTVGSIGIGSPSVPIEFHLNSIVTDLGFLWNWEKT